MANLKSNNNSNINTYSQFRPKEKTYLYCWKCGESFNVPSFSKFCDFSCQQEYYAEIRKEDMACFREWSGRD